MDEQQKRTLFGDLAPVLDVFDAEDLSIPPSDVEILDALIEHLGLPVVASVRRDSLLPLEFDYFARDVDAARSSLREAVDELAEGFSRLQALRDSDS